MEFRVLGPLEVRIDDTPVHLGGRRQQSVLAALLLNADAPLPRQRLSGMVWSDPPPSAQANLRTYLHRLHSALTDPVKRESRLVLDRCGVTLRADPSEIDLQVFEDLCTWAAGAHQSGDTSAAAELYSRALRLWRGAPLEGIDTDTPLYAAAVKLAERRFAAQLRRWRLLVELGAYGEAIGELRAATVENPFREQITELLMTALYKDHRRWEALQVYSRTREQMVDSLGLEPGPELRRAHRRILEDDVPV
ncbi:AfsR/SARP family transcriptional regulator [Glycomyces tenuis]|uniref:AfsR/SARP family transcriptional regulator n=1 Tax=Glycomyces tenuis TaxID=58116 RepID=UPI000409B236|nr:AfsR/SARP family transcriptional regulator [Glycomyces tenuis]